jgi:hypothetical protein
VLEIYDIAGNSWSLGALSDHGKFRERLAQGGFIYAAGGIDGATSISHVENVSLRPGWKCLERRGHR